MWISVQWRHTSETFETFKEFQSEIEIHCNKEIMLLQIRLWKVIFELQVQRTSDELGRSVITCASRNTTMSKVFERRNQALYAMVRVNMTFINLPLYLLKLCFSDYGFYTQKSTIKTVEMTPYQTWYGILKPYFIFLKFGYIRDMFDILKIPNQISATLLRLSQKCLIFLYHYTKAKLFAVQNSVF